jgi:hypothetical protein
MDESYEESFASSEDEIQDKIVKQKKLRKTKSTPVRETKRKRISK